MRRSFAQHPVRWAVALGVGLRLLWLCLGTGRDRFLMPDSLDYTLLAGDLGSFSTASTRSLELLTLYRPPAYPAFVWLTSLGDPDRVLLVVLAQVALAGLNIGLCFRLADRILGRRAGAIAALLLAIDPVSISHSLLITTETLTATFLLLGLVALVEARQRTALGPRLALAAASGLAIALCSLTRPVALYLVPIVALVALFASQPTRTEGARPLIARRLSFGVAALFLVGSAIPVAGWFARNQALSGRAVYSTVQGENLALYGLGSAAADDGRIRLVYAGGGTADTSVADADPELPRRASHRALVAMGVDPDRPPPGLLETPEYAVAVDAELSSEGLRLLREHPRGAVLLGGYGGARMMALPGASANLDQLRPGLRVAPVRSAVWAWAVGWVVLVDVGAVAGAVLIWRRAGAWAAALLLAPLGYYVLASAGTFAYVRFRVPISPLMCILAATALVAGLDRLRAPGERTPGNGAAI